MPLKTFAFPRTRRAFTLIELLAVITIVAILSALIMTGVSHARNTSQTAHCADNLRKLATLSNLWSIDNNGWVPQAQWYATPTTTYPTLLSYGLTEDLMQCPATDAPYSYGINVKIVSGGPDGQWGKNYVYYNKHGRYHTHELDPAETILFADTINGSGTKGFYMAGNTWVDYRHQGKAQVVYLDGHVDQLTQDILSDDETWKAGIINP